MAMPTDVAAWRRRVYAASHDMHTLWKEARVKKTFNKPRDEMWDEPARLQRLRPFQNDLHQAVLRLLSTDDEGYMAVVSDQHPFAHEQPRHGSAGFRYGYHNKPGDTYTLSHCSGKNRKGRYFDVCVEDGGTWTDVSVMPAAPDVDPHKFKMSSSFMAYLVAHRPNVPAFQIHLQYCNVTFSLRDPFRAWFAGDELVAMAALYGTGSRLGDLPLDIRRLIFERLRDAEFYRRIRLARS